MDLRSRSADFPSRTGRSWRSTSWPTLSAWPSSTWRSWKTDHRTTEGKERTMRLFVAGATGAIGTRLVPKLVERGHEVIGTSRSMDRAQRLHAMGAEPVALDLLDPRAVREAVLDAKPEAIIHQATGLTGLSDFKHFDRSFHQTNLLRTEGTDALLAAAKEAGVSRIIAQSFASYRYAREGAPAKIEEDRLDPTPAPAMRETEDAMAYLDRVVTEAGG